MTDWGEWEWKTPTPDEEQAALLAALEKLPPGSLVYDQNGMSYVVEAVIDAIHMRPHVDACLKAALEPVR
jgi:hypothetical protein